MPHLDGYQFVQAIRGDTTTEDIPLVIMSALVQDRDRLQGLMSGADQYLFKPVQLKTLIAAIHAAIQLGSTDRFEHLRHLSEGGSV